MFELKSIPINIIIIAFGEFPISELLARPVR